MTKDEGPKTDDGHSSFVVRLGSDKTKLHEEKLEMETKIFQAPAIHCGHCTMTIEREVKELAGVATVKADQNTQMVTVSWQAPATWDQIKGLLTEIGYPPAN